MELHSCCGGNNLRGKKGAPLYVSKWGWDWFLGTGWGQITACFILGVFLLLAGALSWMTTDGTEQYKNDFEQSIWFSWCAVRPIAAPMR